MGNLRDQITGHQATEAEQRAQKEREALLFNAQLALNKAEITMKRDKLAADIEILKAGGSLDLADLNITTQYLGQYGRLTEVKAELLNQDIQIQQGHINLMTAAGQAALASLQLQLDALNQVYEILDSIKPISLGEIRIPHTGNNGGGSVSTGPTPEEIAAQLAADIADFLQNVADTWRGIMGGVSQSIAELNHWYEEQAARARELGLPLAELNELYEQQLLNLQNDTLASLGLQSLATIQQFEDLTESLKYLRDWGVITEAQMRELGDSMYISLVDSLLQYVDNEDVRRQLEDLRFRMEIANYQLQFQYLQSLGLLTQAEIDVINGLFTDIQAAYDAGTLAFQLPSVNQTQSNGSNAADEARSRAEQALREALDRLRSAVETLTQWQKGLTLSASSPLTTSQQYQEAQRQYMTLLAAAQGGDINAMAQLAEAAQTYLDLAAEMFGTSGAGYAAIFDAVSQQVAAIAAMGQQILDSVPPQMAGTEDRLDTIADILRAMAGLGAGGTGGAPTTAIRAKRPRRNGLLIAGPSLREKKLPHRPRRAIGTTGTGQTGKIVDRRPTVAGQVINYRRVAFEIDIGTITATNASFTLVVKEGDVTSAMTSIADADLDGTEAAAVPATGTRTSGSTKNVSFRLGYKGTKRYVQVAKLSSTVTATTPVSAAVLLMDPDSAPVA